MNEVGADPCDWDKHFKLLADIDLGGYAGDQFNIIGNPTIAFTGDFDGSGYKVLNFTWTSVGRDMVGLFGCVDGGGLIKNVGLEDANVDAGSRNYIGILVGMNISGAITDCYSTGRIRGYNYVGGLIGENHGLIANCYSTVSVSGDRRLGGLVGYNEDGTINECHSTGIVSGGHWLGGLVGLSTSGMITSCYSKTNVQASSGAFGVFGGLVGEDASGIISNCYSTGLVEADNLVQFCGGLVGIHAYGTISNCYSTSFVGMYHPLARYYGGLVGTNEGVITDSFWDTDTSGLSNMCGLEGGGGSGCDDGNGKSTAEMQTESTFTDAGWDFVGETANGTDDIWDICEGTNYPKLVWQIPPGDFLCPDGVNFFDYSFFASQWAEDDCAASNDCEGRDLDQLGSVDIKDLRIFADNWLEGF